MNGLRITLAAGVAAAIACTSLAWTHTAHADEESGLAIGARVAYAVPFGDSQEQVHPDGTTTTISMSNFQRGMIPIWFDLGYRFNPSVYLGLFYQYAPTVPATHSCSAPGLNSLSGQTTCDGYEQRFGIDLQYHFLPKEFLDPWVGLGLGMEMSLLNHSTGTSQDTGSFQAWGPQADLQLGADLRVSKRIPFGPFIDLSVAQFGTENTYDSNNNGSPLAFNKKTHGWFTFGLRAQFNL
jgi:outer membrane protein W